MGTVQCPFEAQGTQLSHRVSNTCVYKQLCKRIPARMDERVNNLTTVVDFQIYVVDVFVLWWVKLGTRIKT